MLHCAVYIKHQILQINCVFPLFLRNLNPLPSMVDAIVKVFTKYKKEPIFMHLCKKKIELILNKI